MFSTYKPEDVTILLKDVTGMVMPLGTEERERRIQNGTHYSEMLPIEYVPSDTYLSLFYQALELYADMTADAVGNAARKLADSTSGEPVLVSLARAGTPIGILLKRYLETYCHKKVFHYTISVIRGKGIDRNAMRYILARHRVEDIRFVDGWIGKGAIQRELERAVVDYPGVNPGLTVLSDPAGIADICGTEDDFLIASSCLNSTVSGLLSRTFHSDVLIGPDDFHGAAFYVDLADQDLTYTFIDTVVSRFRETSLTCMPSESRECRNGMEEVQQICRDFNIPDINFVKPGIGEATRVLLRRLPWKILVRSMEDREHLGHLYRLAEEKGIQLEEYPLRNYRACGLIRNLSDT